MLVLHLMAIDVDFVNTSLPQPFGLANAFCVTTAGGYAIGATPGGSLNLWLTIFFAAFIEWSVGTYLEEDFKEGMKEVHSAFIN